MKTFINRNEQIERKAHGALHGHSTRLTTKRQPSRWSAQRTRQHAAQGLVAEQTNLQVMSKPHTLWVDEERAPRNTAIELRSRLIEVF